MLISRGATVPIIHVHNPAAGQLAENGYFKLSKHFQWAISKAFILANDDKSVKEVKRVIILEEDLEVFLLIFFYMYNICSG
jgi:hypothetical protein